ncbi:uncharacterized protein EI90DRAFT_3055471 [Cantharellus anzutake]|uniref:uncharacterized protein n=1 Tax=Cantharellus anzutake TaxID=1750568 RepID=UPI001905673E|nr:uncharacterized protein EI90DRAFT_3055471 [Cantharellus anzutake]KAF8332387.1 hypothetical protein EI90DRAFT_3055471 [Cantharellus anzutake]
MSTESPTDSTSLDRSSLLENVINGDGGVFSASLEIRPAKKKLNPLLDLIETEKVYVDLLAAVIRRVASAWSRSNFPPRQLDAMFRAVESVYRANRGLLSKLKEIGPNPSSPKALGDLLMRWIDDLQVPYTKYCDGFVTGFDEWEPVQSNANLHPVLIEVSSTVPPSSISTTADDTWTLDALFLTPANRMKYYKKLYSRLLKSTQPGRSDHTMLLNANERLVQLLERLSSRTSLIVGSENEAPLPPPPPPHDIPQLDSLNHASPAHTPERVMSPDVISPVNPILSGTLPNGVSYSERGSTPGSSSSGRMSREAGGRDSQLSAKMSHMSAPPSARASTSTLTSPIIDLERRLSTDRVIDIFTMTPKKCRLQMASPNLPFTRRLRFSVNVVVSFVPRSTGKEVVHPHAHIFLLTDLFLVCDRMTEEERNASGNDSFDMWLSYPPLSARHLTAVDPSPSGLAVEVQIMRKETLFIQAESPQAKEMMLRELREAREELLSHVPPRLATVGDRPLPFDPSRGPPPSAPLVPTRSFGAVGFNGQVPPHMQPPPMLGPLRVTSDSPMPPPPLEPPRPQFGRLTAGSDPNLPGGGQIRAITDPIRPNTSDHRPSVPPSAFAGDPSLQKEGPPATFSQGTGRTSFQSSDQSHFPPPPPPLASAPLVPPPRGLSKSPSTPSFHTARNTPFDTPVPPLPRIQPNNDFNNWLPAMPPNQSLHLGGRPDTSMLPGTSIERSFRSSHAPPPPPSLLQTGVSQNQVADQDSPPSSPDEDKKNDIPTTSIITAQMKCKVFLKQSHQQWKSLGAADLLLYEQRPTNAKQLVVSAANKSKTLLISTIVLMDAVERVGKTGVAIELSDKGERTGIVYMIQLKSETSATGFFGTLLAGSDRSRAR